MRSGRALLTWAGLAVAIIVPLGFAATSEYLAFRDPVYITAGFAGVVAMCLALLQPVLARGWLPGLTVRTGRRVHLGAGLALLAMVVVHVAGLWLTSPPDIEDALLLRAPTPFSIWGVVAMWALVAAAALVVVRRRLSPLGWRIIHTGLAGVVVLGGAIHALLIEGTMEPISKTLLCGLAVAASVAAVATPWIRMRRRGRDELGS